MTISEIAHLAGVSRGTVDRVVNNRGAVSEENRRRILEIIEESGYVPNKAGKTLAIRKKNLRLGFLLFNTTNNPFFHDLEKGIDAFARDHAPFGVEVYRDYCSLSDVSSALSAIDRLLSRKIHGLAITPIDSPEILERIRSLMESGIPVVTVNSDLPSSGRLSYVGSDYFRAGQTAAGIMGLFTHGQGRVGILIGSSAVLCHKDREKGFCSVLSERFPEMTIAETIQGRDDDEVSYAETRRLLSVWEPDALYIAAAGTEGALRAVKETGREMTIVAHDVSPATAKALASGLVQVVIEQNPAYQGRKPLELLFEYLGFSTQPRETYFTKNTIVIQENLEEFK